MRSPADTPSRWLVEERCLPTRQGGWSPAYRETNICQLKHSLVSQFGDEPVRTLSTFAIPMWLNALSQISKPPYLLVGHSWQAANPSHRWRICRRRSRYGLH